MGDTSSTPTVLILVFCLLGLIVLLFFLYKSLNKEANGEYTIHRMVYKEGGARDRVRVAALALETRLGVQLWPRSNTNEDGEEMQEIPDEEEQVEGCGSQGSDTEGEDEEEEEDKMNQCGGTREKGSDSLDDHLTLEGSEADDQTRLMDEPKAKENMEEKSEKKQEKVGEQKCKVEASGGPELLIDLNQFSGSAIWSEEDRGEDKGSDVTAF